MQLSTNEVIKMKHHENSSNCCSPAHKEMCCCKIESVVSVDDRGQVVLPKEIRDQLNIKSGDKLAVINMGKGSKICCITMVKVDDLSEMVKELLGPLVKEIIEK